MLKVILTIGVPASGKTTWANALCSNSSNNTVNLNRDDIRKSIFGLTNPQEYKFTKDKEKLVTRTQLAMAKAAVLMNKNIIISDTNISERTRNTWKNFCRDEVLQYAEQLFPISLDEAHRRNALRDGGVPPDVINKMYFNYEKQFGDKSKKYIVDHTKPEAIICDIDGTLANMANRSPFDWDRVGEDTLNEDVAVILDWAFKEGIVVILMSGRDSICKPWTEAWLTHHGVKYDSLIMRPKGDSRKDSVVKLELFDNNVRDNYKVLYVLDDRPQVVDMWHDIGLKCWAVADQRIKF